MIYINLGVFHLPDLKINEIDFYSKKFVFISLQKEYLYSWIILQVSYILKDVYLIKNMFFRFFLETTCSKLAGLSFRKIVNLVRKKASCKLKKNNSLFDCRLWIDFSSNFWGFKYFYFVMNLQEKSYSQRIKIWCECFENPWVLFSYLHKK